MASDNNTLRKDLGPVSAYAVAVAHGFDGTEAEWEQYIANASTNAAQASASATAAAQSEANAETAKEAAVTAKVEAQTAAQSASAAYGTSLLAPNYSTEATYTVGQHVIYSGNLYSCTTAITTPEAWDATHWTQVQVGNEVSDLKSAIDDVNDVVFEQVTQTYQYDDLEWDNGYLSGGSVEPHTAYKTSNYIAVEPGIQVAYDGLRSPSSSYAIIGKYGADKSFLGKENGTGGKDTGTYTVDENIYYIRVVTYNYNGDNYFDHVSKPAEINKIDGLAEDIAGIETEQIAQNNRLEALEEAAPMIEYTVEGFDDYNINISGGISKTGADWEYQNAVRSGYISTDGFVSITAHIKAVNQYECAIASYDSNQNFISEKSLICNDTSQTGGLWLYCDGTIVIGDDVKYIRITRGTNELVNGQDTIVAVKKRSLEDDYLITKETVETLVEKESVWKGKKWYAFGTSLTDSTYLDPNNDPTGKYPQILNQWMQANLVNKGKGGGGITSHSNGAILTAIQNTDFSDADLVTLEGFPNDYSAAPGEFTDTTTDTLCGALYVALTTIYQKAPNATVVLITASQGKLNAAGTAGYPINFVSATGNYQVEYNEAIIKMGQYFGCHVIDAGGKAQINNYHPDYLVDHIHHSWAGGWQYAATIWQELQKIYPNTSNPYFE